MSETPLQEPPSDHPQTIATVFAEGEIDLVNADDFGRQLVARIDHHTTALVIDMSAVAFIDSSGLAQLAMARTNLGPTGRLVLRHPTEIVRRALLVTGLDTIFDIED